MNVTEPKTLSMLHVLPLLVEGDVRKDQRLTFGSDQWRGGSSDDGGIDTPLTSTGTTQPVRRSRAEAISIATKSTPGSKVPMFIKRLKRRISLLTGHKFVRIGDAIFTTLVDEHAAHV